MVIFQIKILRRDKRPQQTENTLFHWTTLKIQHLYKGTTQSRGENVRPYIHFLEIIALRHHYYIH